MLKIIVNNIVNSADKKKAFEIRDLVFCEEQKVSKKIEFDGLDEFCDQYLARLTSFQSAQLELEKKKKAHLKLNEWLC